MSSEICKSEKAYNVIDRIYDAHRSPAPECLVFISFEQSETSGGAFNPAICFHLTRDSYLPLRTNLNRKTKKLLPPRRWMFQGGHNAKWVSHYRHLNDSVCRKPDVEQKSQKQKGLLSLRVLLGTLIRRTSDNPIDFEIPVALL